jgi:hypothetical protein
VTYHSEPADPLIPVLNAARRAGNPAIGGDPQYWPGLVRMVRRRWSSFKHRHPAPAPDTRGARVEDLARGLLARRARRRATVELSDCRELARRFARVLSPDPDIVRGEPDPARGSR